MSPMEHMVRALKAPENPKHFFGKPCAFGHDGLRFRSNPSVCVHCSIGMNRSAPPDVKQAAVYDMKYGDRITDVAMRYGISRRALGRWLKEAA